MRDFFKAYFIFLAKLITFVAVVFIGIPLVLAIGGVALSKTVSENGERPLGDHTKKIAVVELEGIIMKSRETVEELYRQADDASVKGIVLRIDSPGGAVGPSQEIYETVKKLKSKKPIVVSMGSVAASGGLYSALGATKIYAQSGTITGSIGVIMQAPNFTELAQKVGVEMVTIKSGKLKDVGNSFRKMLPEEEEYLQKTLHASHQEFITAVSNSRNIPREKVVGFADGRIILGTEAKELGLIDEIGDIYDAARGVFEILKEPLPGGVTPHLFYPKDKYRELRKLFEAVSSLPTFLSSSGYSLKYLLQ